MDVARDGLLRALCFHDALGCAPTRVELFLSFDVGSAPVNVVDRTDLDHAFHGLLQDHIILERRGRVAFAARSDLIMEHEEREAFFPRKIRRARQVAWWLARLGGVRFVALCNTTAIAHARDEGDLDFFVITKSGSMWQTRGLATLPFKLMNLRPRQDRSSNRDAVCLSFFVDDTSLDLSPFLLKEDDPYFRHWFLSLLPLVDDGVLCDFWRANARLVARHPFAGPWIMNPDLCVKNAHAVFPVFLGIEFLASKLQRAHFPKIITSVMNQDSRVVVNDHALKFHVDDRREAYREVFFNACSVYGISP